MSNHSIISKKRLAERRLLARKLHLESLEGRRVLAFDLLAEYASTYPLDVLLAPIDAGSQPDLVIVNSNNSVSVRLGASDGTFGDALTSPAGIGARSAVVGYFNAGGVADLITVNSNDLSVLLGNGDGSFQSPQAISLPSQTPPGYGSALPQNPQSVATGDLNADGTLDLVVTGSTTYSVNHPYEYCNYWTGSCYQRDWWIPYSDSYVNVLMGNGSGGFAVSETQHLGGSNSSTGIAIGDLDNDDNADILIANQSGLTSLLGDGTGDFGSPLHSGSGNGLSSVALGDIDGDPFLDTVTKSGDVLVVQKGRGDGQFDPSTTVPMGQSVQSAVVGDVNADGTLDMVAVGSTYACTIQGWYCYEFEITREVTVALGIGGGSFAEPIRSPLGSAVNNYYFGLMTDAALADLTGDDLADLVAIDTYADVAIVAKGNWPPPGAPFISISDASVDEGDDGASGIKEVSITISLSDTFSQTVTADFHTADGSGVAGSDYEAQSGPLTFAPGQTSQTITLLVYGDRLPEFDESFTITLTNISNAYTGDGQSQISILDNEPRISIDHSYYSDPLTVVEGDTGTTPAVFTITLEKPYNEDVTVDYYTSTGHTADIIAAAGTVRFTPGQISQQIIVQVVNDRIDENLEAFNIYLHNPSANAMITNGAGYCYIEDNDPTPNVSIDDVSRSEGKAGATRFTFTLSLSAPAGDGIYVQFATANFTATTANKDYVAKSGYVYFNSGATTATLFVDVNGDRTKEGDEAFYVNLLSANGAIIVDNRGTGTILNDDGTKGKPPRLKISDTSMIEGKNETRLMVFTVSLSEPSEVPVTVDYSTRNGSALAADDYVAAIGSMQFAPGETSKTVSIVINADEKKEVDEYFYLMLDRAVDARLSDSIGRGVIRNRN